MDYQSEYDNNLFEKYYLDFYNCTYQSAYRILKNPWLAEDIASLTFSKLYERFPLYKNIGAAKFKALCCVCAKNEALDYLRRGKTLNRVLDSYYLEKETTSSFGIPEKEMIMREELQSFHKAFLSLPTSYQKILQLKYSKELSMKQIAEDLRITPKNAEVRLRRAKHKLRFLLEKGLIIVITVFILVRSETYAHINDYFIKQVADKYFLTTSKYVDSDSNKQNNPLVCGYIPKDYELTQEVQRGDISFLQYRHKETNRIFFVDRVRAGIDYQLNYDAYHLKMTKYENNFAIFFEAKSPGDSNSFLWYDKEEGYIYSITYTADLKEMKNIAKEVR